MRLTAVIMVTEWWKWCSCSCGLLLLLFFIIMVSVRLESDPASGVWSIIFRIFDVSFCALIVVCSGIWVVFNDTLSPFFTILSVEFDETDRFDCGRAVVSFTNASTVWCVDAATVVVSPFMSANFISESTAASISILLLNFSYWIERKRKKNNQKKR